MKRERGFTLLEVLIALVVLSIGLLGLAALQTTILRSSHSADLRTQATFLAYDMTDRLRANMDGLQSGYYVNANAASRSCTYNADTDTAASNCTANQIAENDIDEWDAAIARDLPSGVGVVCLDSSPDDGGDDNSNGTVENTEYECSGTGSSYAVKLWWVDEFDANGNPVIKRFSTAVRP